MGNNLTLNLIVDGNYILSRLVFTLHKNNLLFGALYNALDNSIKSYKRLYPFANVYMVSDSKEKSWRKDYIGEYKGTRKKDSDIDWNFVYETYNEFKSSLNGNVKVLEAPNVEGDDWIAFLVNESNKKGISTLIISNDYDIKQLVNYSLNPLYINMMSNQMLNKEKIFLPNNYQTFLNYVDRLPNDDIFNMNDNKEFMGLINGFVQKYEIIEINSIESLFVKIISGDTSDNISSAWSQVKNGRKRGIGEKGAKAIYDIYISEYGEISLEDPDFCENVADLICEKKKLNKSKSEDIIDNLKLNIKLIDLRMQNIPTEIIKKMTDEYEQFSTK